MTAVSQLSKDLNGTGFQPFALPPTPALANLAAEIDAASLINGGTITGTLAVVGTLTATAIEGTPVGAATPSTGKFTTAAVGVNNGLILTGQTTDAAAATATLTNSPTAGNPAFWLRISVNGTNMAVPAWTA